MMNEKVVLAESEKSNSFKIIQQFLPRFILLIAIPFSTYAETFNTKEIKQCIYSPFVGWAINPELIPNNEGRNITVIKDLKNQIKPNSKIINPIEVVDPTINLSKGLSLFQEHSEVVIGVVDTGINLGHEFFNKKNIINAKRKLASKSDFGLDFSNLKFISTTPQDTHGHGTHVSGIIKSVYPNVKIIPFKYYSTKASGQENLLATLKALRAAIDAKVDIINYSGGGPEQCKEEKELLQEAESKGILIVAAAGNESSNIDESKTNAYYPASYNLKNIISVGAYSYTSNGQSVELIPSSNYGTISVDIVAPGYRILSASTKGTEIMTGTSQATAFVTGAAALIKSMYPQATNEQIKNILIAAAPEVKSLRGKILSSGKLDIYETMVKAAAVFATPNNVPESPAKKNKVALNKSIKRKIARKST